MTIRVLIADDHDVVREGYQGMLAQAPDIEVVASAASGEQAISQYRKTQPDVVLMDLSMPGMGGMEAARRIRNHDAGARIIMLTMHDSEVYLGQAVDSGISGYLTKTNNADTIVQAVRQVAAGHKYFGAEMSDQLASIGASGQGGVLGRLSQREFEIFLHVAAGQTAEEAAATLNISPKTARNNLSIIKQKLGVTATTELTRLAIRHGLMEA